MYCNPFNWKLIEKKIINVFLTFVKYLNYFFHAHLIIFMHVFITIICHVYYLFEFQAIFKHFDYRPRNWWYPRSQQLKASRLWCNQAHPPQAVAQRPQGQVRVQVKVN